MFACLLILQSATPPSTDLRTWQIDGVERQALIVRPAKATPSAPLVFVFHGHGGGMNQVRRSINIESRWPEATVVYPQGLPTKGIYDPEGAKAGWQQQPTDQGGRDLKLFDAMMATLHKEGGIDFKRVYVTGHSNGGRMTYLLWAERGAELAAVAPSASPAMARIRTAPQIPAFIIAGQEDTVVPYRVQALSIQAVARRLQVSGPVRKEGYAEYQHGPRGLELGTYQFPGGHTVPTPAVDAMVKFFKRH